MTAKAASFVEIYTAYARDVYRFVLYLSGDATAAQDITAETFCRVWLTNQPVRMATVKAWLFVIARNLYRHELRHVRRREPLDPEMPSGSVSGGRCRIEGRVRPRLPVVGALARSGPQRRPDARGGSELRRDCGRTGHLSGGGEGEGSSGEAASGEIESRRNRP